MTTELIQLTNQPKPDVVATAISVARKAESGTSVTRVAVPRPTPQNTGRAGRRARWVIDRWRQDYNHHRIHSALNYQTPAAYAAGCVLPASATPQPPEHSRVT